MTPWHAPPDTLDRFARTPEALDDTTASSVEQHLLHCGACRTHVADAADPIELDLSWEQVADAIDRPTAGAAERLLVRVGLAPDVARVVGATPGLRLAWLATTAILAVAAAVVAQGSGSDAPFLVVAPLVPLGSVLLTFLAADDPAGEAGRAAPMHGFGLVMRRALATLVPTFVILAMASLVQPDLTRGGALWVLPSLALTVGALALATVTRITVATGALAVTWLNLVLAFSLVEGHRVPVADSPLFDSLGQASALAIVVVAGAVLHTRRDHFSALEAT